MQEMRIQFSTMRTKRRDDGSKKGILNKNIMVIEAKIRYLRARATSATANPLISPPCALLQ